MKQLEGRVGGRPVSMNVLLVNQLQKRKSGWVVADLYGPMAD